MRLISAFILLFSIYIADNGVEADIPYAGIYEQCKEFTDYISFQFICSEPSVSPLMVTIQTDGVIKHTLTLNQNGYTHVPLNEAWVRDHALIHCNRTKGSMSLISTFHFFYYSTLQNNNGHVDLSGMVKSYRDFQKKMPRIENIFNQKIDIDADKFMRVRSLSGRPFVAILKYVKNGTPAESMQASSNGIAMVPLSDVYDSVEETLDIDPGDIEVAFDQPSIDDLKH